MIRGAFLLLAWAPGDAAAAARAAALGRRLDAEGGWRRAAASDRYLVWRSVEGRLDVRPLPHGRGVVLGDLFPMPGSLAAASPVFGTGPGPHGPLAVARALSRAHWGAFVAVLQGAGPGPAGLYRDPSGDLDAVGWSLGDQLDVVVSDFARAPRWLRPPRLALDWTMIGAHVAVTSAVRLEPLLEGLRIIAPGDLGWLAAARPPESIWRAADFVANGVSDLPAVSAELVRRVDDATAAMTGLYGRVLMELSGGLDSAIVAGSLAATGLSERVAAWVNRFGDRPEGDERAYARAVTDRLGGALTALAKPLTPLDLTALEALSDSLRPALNGTDPARDGDMAARLAATGSEAILSGQGGDAIFFQMPGPLVLADALSRDGLRALGSPLLGQVARRTHAPAWQVLRAAWRAHRRSVEPPTLLTSLITAPVHAAAQGRRDPWLAGTERLPAGKRLQLRSLSFSQVHRADCRRRRAGDLVYPLLAQPVVELCLSIAAPDLAAGDYDRPFARTAFADRLPPAIVARRAKGNLTAYFARWVAASAEVLRPYLLDGCLCAAGVLDRGLVEQALDPQQLIWAPQPGDLVNAAMTEAWVRRWQGQVPDSLTAPRGRA